ncbi:hypothetical protein JYB88_11655 [Shewanella cyperi]|uniref:Uncharacterized protein n=1 Tax=Shewanella cyperi TaxID=2814292 RepID=A0A974XKG7_9GAMM|nr:polysialyltransferase family glycosyltransferase [Shewanella cyperi]QSX28913.1 hypothetical protein JYB88_11655 [Shewanella cyperi]
MSRFFLVRNFLSVKTATAIAEQYSVEVPSVFSIEADSEEYFKKVSSSVSLSIPVLQTEPINWLFERFNYLRHYKELFQSSVKIADLFKKYNVTELFVNYPVHEKDALYVKVAKRLGIHVSFYEEGSCFYTGGRGRKKNIISEIKFWMKHTSLWFIGIQRGYGVSADNWYSLLPIEKRPWHKVTISYDVRDYSGIKYLFLSRPVTLDFPSVSIELQIKSILKFVKKIPAGETLFIKFHPRETEDLKRIIISELDKLAVDVIVKTFSDEIPAEDVVFNMPANGIVCGFDSSTLIYGYAINKNVTYCSVLSDLRKHDTMGELENLYHVYKKEFKHIKFI